MWLLCHAIHVALPQFRNYFQALFEAIQVLEDPFLAFKALDGIDVHEELEVLHWHQLINARSMFFPNAPPYPVESSRALTAHDPLATAPDTVPWEDGDEEASVVSTHDLSRRVSSFALPDRSNPWAIKSNISSLSSSTWRMIPTPVYSHASGTCSGFSFSQANPRFSVSSASTKEIAATPSKSNTARMQYGQHCKLPAFPAVQDRGSGSPSSSCDYDAPPLFSFSPFTHPHTVHATQ